MGTVNVLLRTDLSFCFILGGKTNQLNLQNTATKAIIQGLMPDQNYTVQIIAYNKDKESKPAQGQFRSTYLQDRVLPWDSVPGLSPSPWYMLCRVGPGLFGSDQTLGGPQSSPRGSFCLWCAPVASSAPFPARLLVLSGSVYILFIGTWLLYDAVLVSALQQSASAVRIHRPLFRGAPPHQVTAVH